MKAAGKVVAVTGAASGIGRELALLLLGKGARVAGIDWNGSSLEETASLAGSRAGDFLRIIANIADQRSVQTLPEQVCARFGTVDGLINNAGVIQPFLRLNDLDYADIEKVLNVNLLGTLYTTKAFLPHLLRRPEAHIVNLSSMGGFVPIPGQTIYCAAKAAVKLMSEGLSSELIGTHVRVTVALPGAIATNIRQNSGLLPPSTAAGAKQGGRALSACKAAEIILDAMERDVNRVFVGRDAALMDKISRVHPDFAARLVAKNSRGLLSTDAQGDSNKRP
jgi:NADP-dependent 3-hydroxy acid dehydrogenase YdfG